jgi:UDP:flavonoid glycosyltransferase YjiC (YdhE family)
MLRVFSKFSQHTIIWQLDISKENLEKGSRAAFNTTILPDNIEIFAWIPSFKKLLTDPRVLLLISHGGLTSCIEAFNQGIPVLGTAIQSDQGYNVQRLTETGLGESVHVAHWDENILFEKMSKMVKDHQK